MTRRSQANEEEEDDFAPMEGQDDQDEEGGEEEEESNNEDPQNSQDPQMQGKDKRSILRTEMRKMIQRGQNQLGDVANTSVGVLVKDLKQMNKLFKQVEAPREAALDSRWLMMASDIGATKAKLLKHDAGAFDVDDFVSQLVLSMGGADDIGEPLHGSEWAKLGRKAVAKSRRVPTIGFMLGPLSAEVKKRAVRQRVQLDKSGEVAKPQELKEDDIHTSENETAANILAVERILGEYGQVNIFRFVVNPHDFAESVENIFYLSFLIRDGKCSFNWSEGENPEPIIWCTSPPNEDDFNEGVKKRQLVLEFDQETWRRAIEVFDIKEPMIPSRPKPVIGGKLYS